MLKINHQTGRPKMKEEDKRSKIMQFRLTKDVYDELKEAAIRNGISMSNYMRVAIEEAIDRDRDRERYGYDEH